MKTHYIFLMTTLFLILSGRTVAAQHPELSGKDATVIVNQVQKKLERFCEMIELVGTYASAPQSRKLSIIKDDVPSLFWRIEERKMVVTSKACPTGRSKRMPEYLRQLLLQSKYSSAAPLYRCRPLTSFVQACGRSDNWHYVCLQDGVAVFEAQVAYHQEYYLNDMSHGVERVKLRAMESEAKKMKVYLLITQTGNGQSVNIIRLGDVIASEREDKK